MSKYQGHDYGNLPDGIHRDSDDDSYWKDEHQIVRHWTPAELRAVAAHMEHIEFCRQAHAFAKMGGFDVREDEELDSDERAWVKDHQREIAEYAKQREKQWD